LHKADQIYGATVLTYQLVLMAQSVGHMPQETKQLCVGNNAYEKNIHYEDITAIT
jgi:hypothetical protein